MKPHLLLLINLILFGMAISFGEDVETTPYGDIQTETLDKSQPMLSVATSSRSAKTTHGKEELEVKVYNNSDQPIYLLEQQIFVDFSFSVKDASGTAVASNQKLAKIKQNRDAMLHISRKLEPGQSAHYYINLLKIYDLVPGQTYTVQLWRNISAVEFGSITKIASNTLQFTVPQ